MHRAHPCFRKNHLLTKNIKPYLHLLTATLKTYAGIKAYQGILQQPEDIGQYRNPSAQLLEIDQNNIPKE